MNLLLTKFAESYKKSASFFMHSSMSVAFLLGGRYPFTILLFYHFLFSQWQDKNKMMAQLTLSKSLSPSRKPVNCFSISFTSSQFTSMKQALLSAWLTN